MGCRLQHLSLYFYDISSNGSRIVVACVAQTSFVELAMQQISQTNSNEQYTHNIKQNTVHDLTKRIRRSTIDTLMIAAKNWCYRTNIRLWHQTTSTVSAQTRTNDECFRKRMKKKFCSWVFFFVYICVFDCIDECMNALEIVKNVQWITCIRCVDSRRRCH